MRPRPAPSAARIATSVCRDDARAINSAATFAHAINSTNPTAPCNSSSGRPMNPNIPSRNDCIRTVHGFPWSSLAGGKLLGKLRGDGIHLALRLLHGDAGLEPGGRQQESRRPAKLKMIQRNRRHIIAVFVGDAKIGRQHADDGGVLPVHQHFPVQGCLSRRRTAASIDDG